MIIYKVTNIINNKIYIGQTIHELEIRKRQHENAFKYGAKNAFAKAINKYGKENFRWEIIDKANSIDELNKKEEYYIKFYHSLTTENGYNIKYGGNNNIMPDVVKKKISIAQLGEKNHMYGKTGALNSTSKKVINITTNMIFDSASEAAKYDNTNVSHVCAVCRGERGSTKNNIYRYLDNDNNIIYPDNEIKIRNKPVQNLDTGEIFNSATEAEIYYQGYKSGNLSKACKGINKSFANYKWRYI